MIIVITMKRKKRKNKDGTKENWRKKRSRRRNLSHDQKKRIGT